MSIPGNRRGAPEAGVADGACGQRTEDPHIGIVRADNSARRAMVEAVVPPSGQVKPLTCSKAPLASKGALVRTTSKHIARPRLENLRRAVIDPAAMPAPQTLEQGGSVTHDSLVGTRRPCISLIDRSNPARCDAREALYRAKAEQRTKHVSFGDSVVSW